MANAPPPYTEQYQANPPVNPNYPAGGYAPYPAANPGYVDPSKGAQVGYPAQPGYPSQQQPGYPPQQPQPGYPLSQYPHPQVVPAQQPQAQQQTIVVTQAPVVTGNCPACRVGMLTEDFTCCGICLAIFCFPLGLICCFLMRERRCTTCGARL